jgi:3-hydroxyacyl-CoA dehydrogenase
MAMGPFAVSDLAGIDVGWRAKRERIERGAAPTFALTDLTDKLVAAGRSGRRPARAGIATSPARANASRSRGRRDRRRRARGDARTTRAVSDDEIVRALRLRADQRGRAHPRRGHRRLGRRHRCDLGQRLRLPAARGGPMRYATDTGIATVVATVERFAQADPDFWKPDDALRAL